MGCSTFWISLFKVWIWTLIKSTSRISNNIFCRMDSLRKMSSRDWSFLMNKKCWELERKLRAPFLSKKKSTRFSKRGLREHNLNTRTIKWVHLHLPIVVQIVRDRAAVWKETLISYLFKSIGKILQVKIFRIRRKILFN